MDPLRHLKFGLILVALRGFNKYQDLEGPTNPCFECAVKRTLAPRDLMLEPSLLKKVIVHLFVQFL